MINFTFPPIPGEIPLYLLCSYQSPNGLVTWYTSYEPRAIICWRGYGKRLMGITQELDR